MEPVRYKYWVANKSWLLNAFTEYTRDGEYKKLLYPTWKNIKYCHKDFLFITYDSQDKRITIAPVDADDNLYNMKTSKEIVYSDHVTSLSAPDFANFLLDYWGKFISADIAYAHANLPYLKRDPWIADKCKLLRAVKEKHFSICEETERKIMLSPNEGLFIDLNDGIIKIRPYSTSEPGIKDYILYEANDWIDPQSFYRFLLLHWGDFHLCGNLGLIKDSQEVDYLYNHIDTKKPWVINKLSVPWIVDKEDFLINLNSRIAEGLYKISPALAKEVKEEIKEFPYDCIYLIYDETIRGINISPYDSTNIQNPIKTISFYVPEGNAGLFKFLKDFWGTGKCPLLLTGDTSNSTDNLITTFENMKNATVAVSDTFYSAANIFTKKEKKKDMKNDLFNFDFGPVSGNQFRMSPYGIAINTDSNGWVAYDTKKEEIFNVEILNFDLSKFIYKMPVALSKVEKGDILLHSNKPVFVRSVNENGTVSVVNYADATVVDILPIKSPFGFNFFTKICALIDFNGESAANEDNPFGNFLPFLMLTDENADIDPLMLFFMTQNKKGDDKEGGFFNNPMLLYLLMKQHKSNDVLPLMFMSQNNPFSF